jgi:hypothetical protein
LITIKGDDDDDDGDGRLEPLTAVMNFEAGFPKFSAELSKVYLIKN